MTKQELERVRDCLLRAGREMGMEEDSTVELTVFLATSYILGEFLDPSEQDCYETAHAILQRQLPGVTS